MGEEEKRISQRLNELMLAHLRKYHGAAVLRAWHLSTDTPSDGEVVVYDSTQPTGFKYAVNGSPGAPLAAQYLALALHGDLTAERRFVPGLGLSGTDGGANNDYDLVCLLAAAAQAGIISLSAQTLGAGVKTFTSIPVLPASDPTEDNEAARKKYVDDHGGGVDLWTAVAPQTLTASSTITVTDGEPWRQIDSASAITLTSEPHIAAGRNGQVVHLHNTGSYNITLKDVNALGGSLMRFTGNTITIQPAGTLGLVYDSDVGFWVQTFLLNPQTFTPSIATFTSQLSATREVAAATTEDTLPDFELTYIGSPSACSIDVQTGSHPGGNYPISVPSPYTDLDSGTSPPSDTFYRGVTVLATVVMRATATVAGQGGLTKDITYTYYNRRYCGPDNDGGQLTTAEILALDDTAAGESGLSNSKYATFTNIDTAAGEYIYICFRSALGTLSWFSIENEIAAFTSEGIMSHTNDLGFTENFQQYRSNLTNFGANKDVRTLGSQPNNRVYIGPHTDTQIDDAGIGELDDTADGESIVSSTVARTYTDIEIDAGEYLWLCHPDRISDLATIKDGTTGFAIDGEYKNNVTHVNQFGYSETYRCWRSTNPGIYPDGENIVVTV